MAGGNGENQGRQARIGPYDVGNGAKKQSQLRHISGRPFNSRCFALTQM